MQNLYWHHDCFTTCPQVPGRALPLAFFPLDSFPTILERNFRKDVEQLPDLKWFNPHFCVKVSSCSLKTGHPKSAALRWVCWLRSTSHTSGERLFPAKAATSPMLVALVPQHKKATQKHVLSQPAIIRLLSHTNLAMLCWKKNTQHCLVMQHKAQLLCWLWLTWEACHLLFLETLNSSVLI